MFEAILNQPLQPAGGYNVFNQINRAVLASDNHETVLLAQNELNRFPGIDLQHFTREMLRDVWRSDCRITTKYLATLWWGGVHFGIFNRAYSHQNVDRIREISEDLEVQLNELSNELYARDRSHRLPDVFMQMYHPYGFLKVPFVGIAFFTKVLQFHVAAHQRDDQTLLPIIADKWMMKAMYCEMTDAADFELRDTIFFVSPRGIALHGVPESYILYTEWYNNRCHLFNVSPWEMEGRLFRNPVVAQQYAQLAANQ